jgi:hypothetical protein
MRRFAACLACLGLGGLAGASNLFSNPGFETGNLSSWTVTGTTNSTDAFTVDSTDATTPDTFNPTAGPDSGLYYAVSDSFALVVPEATAIYQTITIPTGTTDVVFSVDIFVNDWCTFVNGSACSGGLGGEAAIWASGANPLTATPIAIIYSADTQVSGGSPNPYVLASQDVTGILTPGTSYIFGVLEGDSSAPINVGVDNFSLATQGGSVPEPGTLVPVFLAGGILAYRARKAFTQQN